MTARMASAFDRYSRGRLTVNVVCGGDPVELAGDGVFLSHGQRYEQADEYIQAWTDLLQGKTVDMNGRYVRIEGGSFTTFPCRSRTLR